MTSFNIGCGRFPIVDVDWQNVDVAKLPGVDCVANLDDRDKIDLPYNDDIGEHFHLSHVIEHIVYPLPLMQELWRIAKPGATMQIRCPHIGSDDAWEDPTHVRALGLQSFGYFGQGAYWRADYGYRGDWKVETVWLRMPERFRGAPQDYLWGAINHERNAVAEMVADLVAVKPARDPLTAGFGQPLYQPYFTPT